MSITSGTNKWASRAVVVLQLAAWSAVGIVLLEKGVASLKKSPAAVDLSAINNKHREEKSEQAILKKGSAIRSASVLEGDVLSVVPLDERIMVDDDDDDEDSLRVTTAVVRNNYPTRDAKEESSEKKRIGTTTMSRVSIDEANLKRNNQSSLAIGSTSNMIDGKRAERNKKVVEKEETGKADVDEKIQASRMRENSEVIPVMSASTRKHLRIGQTTNALGSGGAGGGGAAAAIAMITVGAIMLVLGPAVIVLRNFDERRQERRFLKLSGDEEDLPPTYEEATAAASVLAINDEQAPTYSSLNLNSISCST